MDPNLDVVKGRGGALLREKASWAAACLLAGGMGRAAGCWRVAARRPTGRCLRHARQPARVQPTAARRCTHATPTPPSTALAQMVEMASDKFVCIVDDSKLVSGLGGSKLAMPVEIVQFCHLYTLQRLQVR